MSGAVILSMVLAPAVGGLEQTSAANVAESPAIVQPQDVLPAGISHVMPAVASAPVSGSVGLAPRDPAALAAFARSVSVPGSASYHHFLSPGTFRSTFGPLDATVAQVTSFLAGNGLRTSVSPNGLLVHFDGSTEQVESAFHTSLISVQLPSGRQARATTRALELPSSLSPLVTGIAGVSTVAQASSQLQHSPTALKVPASSTPAPSLGTSAVLPSTLAPKACQAAKIAAHGGGPSGLTDPQGLTDQQIASTYGVNGLYAAHANGAGQRVAIFELEQYTPSNLATFSSCYFGTDLSSKVVVHPVNGGVSPGTVSSGEADLDIENVMGLAPGARIDVYEAKHPTGIIDGYNQMIQDDKAKVITTSWGLCEAFTGRGEAAMENTIFEQAAAQGQTVVAATGDAGANDCQRPTSSLLEVDDPASQPFVLGAGGTTIESSLRPTVETTWNDGSYGAGGGGISKFWPQPSWQNQSTVRGVNNPTTLAAAKAFEVSRGVSRPGKFCGAQFNGAGVTPCRQVPDVAIQADPGVGAITIYNADPKWGGWTTAGGTSSAAPLWAALLADAASLTACGGSIGFVAPQLYSIASSPAARALAFNDITTGTNDTGSTRGLFPATAGYDMGTGLGSPIMSAIDGGVGLAALLCGSLSTALPVVVDVSDGYLDGAGALHAEVHGVGFGSAATPSIAAVQVGGLRLDPQPSTGASGFTVLSSSLLSVVITPDLFAQLSSGGTDASGSHTVVVTTSGGASSETSVNTVLSYSPAGHGGNPIPAVTGLASSGGAMTGGKAITVFGSGFQGATSVTFGGQVATFSVLSSTRIAATVPGKSASTHCEATGTNVTTDVCQVHVVVTGPGGTSTPQPIAAPATTETTGCSCEVTPGLDEFDYFAPPVISRVDITSDPLGYAGAGGGTMLLVHGTGIGPFALIGASFDGSTDLGSWASGYHPIDATSALVLAPARTPSIEPVASGVQIATMATSPSADPSNVGYVLSNVGQFSYAGVPVLGSLSTTTGPSSGGTPVTITGQGVTAVVSVAFSGETVFIGQVPGFATQSTIAHLSSAQISLLTPGTMAGPTDLTLCTASGCSTPRAAGVFRYYPPGTATLRLLVTASGPAAGGATIVIKGANLGCALKVRFGSVEVAAQRLPALSGCGSTRKVKAVVPPGTAGTVVPVQVLTLEGQQAGTGYSARSSVARYTYTR